MSRRPADNAVDKIDLNTQRELLRLRSQALREGLARSSARRLRPAFRTSDRLAEGAHWLRQHRELMGVALAALASWEGALSPQMGA